MTLGFDINYIQISTLRIHAITIRINMLMTKKRMKHRQSSINRPERRRNQYRLDEQIYKSVNHVHCILQNYHQADNMDESLKSNQIDVIKAPDHVRAQIILCYERILIK